MHCISVRAGLLISHAPFRTMERTIVEHPHSNPLYESGHVRYVHEYREIANAKIFPFQATILISNFSLFWFYSFRYLYMSLCGCMGVSSPPVGTYVPYKIYLLWIKSEMLLAWHIDTHALKNLLKRIYMYSIWKHAYLKTLFFILRL